MARTHPDEVAATARRRLELLGLEVAPEPAPEPGTIVDPSPVLTPARVLAAPGRHARPGAVFGPGGRALDWLGSRIPAPLQGGFGLSRGHLALLALVCGVALAVTALLVIRARPEAIAVPPVRTGIPLVSTSSDPAPGATPAPGADSTPESEVVVDVAGKVRRPGVTTLPVGARVIDAIRRAGGPRRGVSLTSLNLARVLVDGEQILVGMAIPAGVAPGAAAHGPSSPGPLVNLNSASTEQLEALPGVGPVTAGKIVEWRTQHGAFTAVDDLLEVDGIGEKTLADLAPHVTL